MTYQERCNYQEAVASFRNIAEWLKGDGYRPAKVEAARRHALAAVRNLEDVITSERPEGLRGYGA